MICVSTIRVKYSVANYSAVGLTFFDWHEPKPATSTDSREHHAGTINIV